MYHSVTFGDKNTWDDWKLVPTSRPVFAPPSQKTQYLEIPGADGSLDFSESLTGYPVYNNREGSMEFYVMNDYDGYRWHEVYSTIMDYLHGKTMRAILEDDPDYYYEGRFSVNQWSSEKDWSKITIAYSVGPYKWGFYSSIDTNWLWDTFNFEKDYISHKLFKDIVVESNSEWTIKTFATRVFGRAAVCPEFIVQSANGNGMDVRMTDGTTGRTVETHLADGTHKIYDIILLGNAVTFAFKGAGTVSINFRKGRL